MWANNTGQNRVNKLIAGRVVRCVLICSSDYSSCWDGHRLIASPGSIKSQNVDKEFMHYISG